MIDPEDPTSFTEPDQAFDGRSALDRINEILGDAPDCTQLVHDVVDFFGTLFKFSVYEDADSGCFGRDEVGERKMNLRLGMKSAALREVLVHELLHGNLLRMGFPLPDSESEVHIFAPHFPLHNLVCHAIMFPQYIKLNLDPAKFTGLSTNQPDSDLETERTRGYWLMIWFGAWLGVKLYGDPIGRKWLAETWVTLQGLSSDLTTASRKIEVWYECKEYMEAKTFVKAYDELMDYMEFEKLTSKEWLYFDAGEGAAVIRIGKP